MPAATKIFVPPLGGGTEIPMSYLHTPHTAHRYTMPVRVLLGLLCVMLLCTACAGPTGTSGDSTTESESHTSESSPDESGTTPSGTPDAEDDPDVLYPGDVSAYEGLLIASVYGPGDKTDAAMEAGFIQLYNAADHEISLEGASLYYKSGSKTAYTSLTLPSDVAIPAGGYYLVRTRTVADHDAAQAVLGLAHYDTEWDVSLDNKEIRLVLAPSGWTLRPTDDLLSDGEEILERAISYFVASSSYTSIGGAVDDLSKNKVAVRTALTDYSGFHTVNLTKRATSELKQLVTRTLDGRVNEVLATRLQEVTFSHDAGVYSAAILLEMTAPAGYTIYYTMDGSDPSAATSVSSRKVYKGRLPMYDSSAMEWGSVTSAWIRYFDRTGRDDTNWYDPSPATKTQIGGYVIKAYATNGIESTPVYTNTYFISPTMAAYDVPVVSISLPRTEIIGSNGFYSNFMPSGSMAVTRPRGTGMMEFFSPDGERVGHSMVEMAVSGNGSSHGGMKSLRIYYKGSLNETGGLESDLNYDIFGGRAVDACGNAITSFDRLLFRNSGNDNGWSHIRDAYMQRVSSDLEIDTLASTPSLVFINGEFWGVYNIRERYSPEYVESHYGVNKDNVTLIESDYGALVYNSDAAAPYVDSSGIEGQAELFNQLYDYIMSHDMGDPSCYDYVTEQLDVASLIDLWVIRLYFCARDWPENNIKLWRNTDPNDPSGVDTKWHFVLLDMDMGMSFYPTGDPNADTSEDSDEIFRLAFQTATRCGYLMRALLENATFREQFLLRYYELATEYFTPDYLLPVLHEMFDQWEPYVTLQNNRWPHDSGDGLFPSRREEAKQLMVKFINERRPYALDHFYTFLHTSEEEILNLHKKQATLSFNEADVTVTVNGHPVRSGERWVLEAADGGTLTVVATAKDGCTVRSVEWLVQGEPAETVAGAIATFDVKASGALIVHSRKDGFDQRVADGSIIAGATYLFYLTEDGDLYAWGDNRHGVLGLGLSVTSVPTPTFVMSNVAKVETSRGTDYEDGCTEFMTAIMTKDGKLYTVGVNTVGQLGRNGTLDDNSLGLVPFDGKVVDVSVGHDHTLVLDENGILWGIGSNTYGQLGQTFNGNIVNRFIRVASRVTEMAAGRRTTIYIANDGHMYGLGDNRWNKLSESSAKEAISSPVLMAKDIAFIGAGEHQSVAVSKKGQLYYIGWRQFVVFQDRTGNSKAVCTVMKDTEVVKADIFYSDMVVLTKEGNAYVYGLNNQGSIGEAPVTGGHPQKLLSGVADVAAGYGFTAYLMQDGTLLVQGDNTYGQGGIGTAGGAVSLIRVNL